MADTTTARKSIAEAASKQLDATFVGFPKLPLEVRLMIWKHACFETQNIDPKIRLCMVEEPWSSLEPAADNSKRQAFLQAQAPAYYSRCAPPAVIHTSQEARIEGLRWYFLRFGMPIYLIYGIEAIPPRVYINWSNDRLCLMYRLHHCQQCHFDRHPPPLDAIRLRRLAQNSSHGSAGLFTYARLPHLQELVDFSSLPL